MMNLNEKKEMIYRLVSSGLHEDHAQLLALCSFDEMSLLNGDKEYKDELERAKAEKIKDLLDMHNKAAYIQSKKGQTAAVEKQLEWICPEKYGKQGDKEENTEDKGNKLIIHIPDNGRN